MSARNFKAFSKCEMAEQRGSHCISLVITDESINIAVPVWIREHIDSTLSPFEDAPGGFIVEAKIR